MTPGRRSTTVTVFFVAMIALVVANSARAEAPIKLIFSSHIGWEVDKSTNGQVCTITSKDECQPGKPNAEPVGFEFPEGVSAAQNGTMYVSDQGNHRVQELTSGGEFLAMVGREVNDTKDHTPGAAEAEKDICTEEEVKSMGVKCRKGSAGSVAGAFAAPSSVTTDSSTGHFYVEDFANWRVDEYTANGQFVLTLGKEVNETKDGTAEATEAEKDVCTAVSKDSCKAGVRSTLDSTEKSAFNFAQSSGDLLAVGGSPEHLLYVGDEHRVQEFDAAGEWKGEIRLSPATISAAPTGQITAVAVDGNSGVAYVVYNTEPTVREFDTTTGVELSHFEVAPRNLPAEVTIAGLAVDLSSRLAIAAIESVIVPPSGFKASENFGVLYSTGERRLVTRFTVPGTLTFNSGGVPIFKGVNGISFNDKDELFGAISANHEFLTYTAVPVAELITGPVTCEPGSEKETSDTFDCLLNAQIDPYNVGNTEAFFEWGSTCAFGSETPVQPVNTVQEPLAISAPIKGLRPNETFCYRLVGNDQNVLSPEQLTGANASFSTLIVKPKIVGKTHASFVTSSSALIFGEVNPENAATKYFFEYGTGESLKDCAGVSQPSCPGVRGTTVLESALYGRIGATAEAARLQPGVTYHYRLVASNKGGQAIGEGEEGEGTFTTARAPSVEAKTGSAREVTPTSAFVSGTVNPGGRPAIYTFELGIYNGAATQYATVGSGATGVSAAPELETVLMTNLEPATKYAFRVTIHSGYGLSEGAPEIFTTPSLAGGLTFPTPVTILPAPTPRFPKQVVSCKRGYARNKHGKCARLKKKPKGKRTGGKPIRKTGK